MLQWYSKGGQAAHLTGTMAKQLKKVWVVVSTSRPYTQGHLRTSWSYDFSNAVEVLQDREASNGNEYDHGVYSVSFPINWDNADIDNWVGDHGGDIPSLLSTDEGFSWD